jgi:glycyl-tRNA synthetase
MKMYGSNFHYFSFFKFAFIAIWQEDIFKNVISHAKSTALFFRQAKYDLSAVYAHKRSRIKKNIREYWKSMVQMISGLDASILMHPTTWKASGMLTL